MPDTGFTVLKCTKCSEFYFLAPELLKYIIATRGFFNCDACQHVVFTQHDTLGDMLEAELNAGSCT